MPKLSPVSYKQLVKVFEAEGFRCVRTEGDHMVFTKPGIIRPVVIPYAPQFDVGAWGTCQDQALNNLTDELHQRQGVGESTGDERI